MRTLLVYSNDHVGSTMSGPGIRAYHFARELAGSFEVTLMAPNAVDLSLERVEVAPAVAPGEVARTAGRFDAVVAQYLPLSAMRRLARSDVRVVYDLYVPLLGEYLGMADATAASVEGARLVQRAALATGDAFVCAGERQRDLWLGMLAALGRIDLDRYRRDPSLRGLIDVVPFGLPEAPPVAGDAVLKGVLPGIRGSDKVLLWGGGIWNWLDPLTVIRAVERLSRLRGDVKLVFLGLDHPQVGRMQMADRAIELARSLEVLDRFVFFRPGWLPYEERQAFLLEADLGVSAHFDTFETRFAFRTRLLDYLWAGLPIVTTGGDELGDLVLRRGLGRVVGAEDVGGWVDAIQELLENREAYETARAGLAGAGDDFSWPRVVEPLARLLATPGARVDGPSLRPEELGLRLRSAYEAAGARGVAAKLARRARRAVFRRRS